VDDVIPHVCGGHQKVGDLIAVWWPFGADVPGVRTGTGWASGGYEDLILVREHLRQCEGVPRAAAPPQRLPAHDRKAQRHGGERVCHDDLAGLVEDEVAGTGEFGQPGPYRRDIERQPSGEVACTWRAPGAREPAVDGKPQILQTHPGILPHPKRRDVVARTRTHQHDRGVSAHACGDWFVPRLTRSVRAARGRR
jgi:hypothetical protein